MKIWQRTVLCVIAVIIPIVIGLMTWDPLTAYRPPADPVTRHDTRIRRDSFGVPHIDGRTDADVAYGLAYAEAEDDFPHDRGPARGDSRAIGGDQRCGGCQVRLYRRAGRCPRAGRARLCHPVAGDARVDRGVCRRA
jgi:hypothetical protein